MKVLDNKILTHVPPIKQAVDDLSDLPYIPADPLPKKSFSMYICGFSSSGKTTLWNSMLLSHPTKKKPDIPRFYYRFFDKIFIFSPSKDTLPLDKLKIGDDRIFIKYTNEDLQNIISEEKENENLNNLIILDDSIKQIKNNQEVHKLILNRRHLTQNPNEEGHAGLSVIITSQKYNACDLITRVNMSDIILFKTENSKELNCIKEELMGDLEKDIQDKVLKLAWKDKYSFLLIKNYLGTKDRYYVRFNKIIFEDTDDNGAIDEIKIEEKENDKTNLKK
tara:strand:- start:293 stop:1126 length:834 start_codon:yes stop_codon:yes gene_type:complete